MTETDDVRSAGAARSHGLDQGGAPDSPRIRRWNRRIVGWGCLPVFVAGFVASFGIPFAAEVGTAIGILVGLPIAVHALRLRRRNRSAYSAAVAQAEATGMRVKTTVSPDGDHQYLVVPREVATPIDFDRDAG